MVSLKSVEKQLKRIHFNHHAWNHAEAMELPNILMPDETVFECVNGYYEGGFALLVATNVRLLLIDKKPFKFLTVEDLRFDMINEIDYSHRLFGARISVSAGAKNLKFMSVNQQRLRKLITHIQHRMAETKKEQMDQAQNQQQHLEKINQQLQAYLLAQHQQQLEFNKQIREAQAQGTTLPLTAPEPVRPAPQLADYLYAQTLLQQYQQPTTGPKSTTPFVAAPLSQQPASQSMMPAQNINEQVQYDNSDASPQLADLYSEGMREIFGKREQHTSPATPAPAPSMASAAPSSPVTDDNTSTVPKSTTSPLEINPLRIAYSKLPMALRNRSFGRRPSASVKATPPPISDPTLANGPAQTAGAR